MQNLGKKSNDYAALKKRLSELDVTVFKEVDGNFTVYTTCEPLFCYSRETIEEIDRAVEDTLSSYISTFYQVKDVKVVSVSEEIEKSPVPQQLLTPYSRIRTTIPDLIGAAA